MLEKILLVTTACLVAGAIIQEYAEDADGFRKSICRIKKNNKWMKYITEIHVKGEGVKCFFRCCAC
jgi:hypothetical protein